jgi:ubiquinone/menaquinone biosynthesis C-methylase UbiE
VSSPGGLFTTLTLSLSREGTSTMANPPQSSHYVIRGGLEGRERLRLVARVMRPTTLSLFERAGIARGMSCVDVGCGGGDVTLDLAEIVGPAGHVVGTDIDETKIGICRDEARDRGLAQAEFRLADATFDASPRAEFDAAYARFLLTHLPEPGVALRHMKAMLKPRGLIIVEDIDFRGSFCHPMNAAYQSYLDLYTTAVQRRGGDPNIGPRLPELLSEAGFENIEMNVVQPAGRSGAVKVVTPLTMENIADAVLAEGLAGPDEIDSVVAALYEIARDEHTVMSIPRVVQAWGRLP